MLSSAIYDIQPQPELTVDRWNPDEVHMFLEHRDLHVTSAIFTYTASENLPLPSELKSRMISSTPPDDTDQLLGLKADAFGHFAIGAIPLEQWATVFANPNLASFPGLRCKAFTVWFGTVLDYLGNWTELKKDFDQLRVLGVDAGTFELLAQELHDIYAEIASGFNRQQQVFFIDRRNQNAHGRLDAYRRDVVTVKWFDGSAVKFETISIDEFRQTVNPLYRVGTTDSTLPALVDMLDGEPWTRLEHLYTTSLGGVRLADLARSQGLSS